MSTNDDREPVAAGTAAGPPRLPVRASIYIDVDGTVHFGALFEGLLPVAEALGAPAGTDAVGLELEDSLSDLAGKGSGT